MSRAFAGVVAICLGFPILAIVAISATGAFSPSLLSSFLIGGVVVTFVVLALFEIRRLVEGGTVHHGRPHGIVAGVPAGPGLGAAVAPPPETMSETAPRQEIRVPDAPETTGEVVKAPEGEPIVVESGSTAEAPAVAVVVAEEAKPVGTADSASESTPSVQREAEETRKRTRGKKAPKSLAPEEVVPIAAKNKPKSGRSKRPVKG
jgi:hypothetical protein